MTAMFSGVWENQTINMNKYNYQSLLNNVHKARAGEKMNGNRSIQTKNLYLASEYS